MKHKNKIIAIGITLVFLFTSLVSVSAIASTPRIELDSYDITTTDKSNIFVSGTVSISKGQLVGVYDSSGIILYNYTQLGNTNSSSSFKVQIPARFISDGTTNFKVKSLPLNGVINGSNPKTFTVKIGNSKQNQTITANNLTLTINEKKNINAKASSGLPLTYTSSNPSVATVDSNGVAVGRKTGNTKIVITQAGNNTYNSVTKEITITVADTSSISLKTPALKGNALYNNKVELSWRAVSNATRYEVYCNDKKVATVKTTTYKQTKLKTNSTYKYKVRALSSNGSSNFSNVVSLKAIYRNPHLLMVDDRSDNKRVKAAFESVGCKVTIVKSTEANKSKIDPSKYDGLIIPGGGNIDPKVYGAKKHSSTHGTNISKDRVQIYAVNKFKSAKKPILGICRGQQIINVACGGTIKQNLKLSKKKSVYQKGWGWTIKNKKGYWMYKLYGAKTKNTYQYHHQCIGKLGKDLVATSWYNGNKKIDKHIEAIEHKTLPIYGVQWHPDSEWKSKKTKKSIKFLKGFKTIVLNEMAK